VGAALSYSGAEVALELSLNTQAENPIRKPIGQFQVISHMLAEMATDIEAARQLTYHAAWLKSKGNPAGRKSNGKTLCHRNSDSGGKQSGADFWRLWIHARI